MEFSPMRICLLVCLFLSLLLGACSSGPKPSDEHEIPFTYHHTFDFMWEQVTAELGRFWDLDEKNRAEHKIRTAWQEHLMPMNRQGHRIRILVRIEGSDGEGYRVKVSQETEENTNDRNPLSSTDADWESTESDGAEGDRFLVSLARRLRPDMSWKRELIR